MDKLRQYFQRLFSDMGHGEEQGHLATWQSCYDIEQNIMINFHTQTQVDTTLSFINFPKLKKRYADNLSIIFVANMYFSV